MWGWIGGIAGGLIGTAGGIIGTDYSIKYTNSQREQPFTIKATAACWIAGIR